ncbi:leukotriene B4 receptor 1-like [Sphaerodactylus townsendi]|uniref:leukotriene B4 receptor 1-like n=1 Tax=Sphaerodactylus townsendi TaxID=933632 RepID=UPI002025ECCB|nr:leukotriene B4 receptor 1-like [Sphaerodactylus townsendi]
MALYNTSELERNSTVTEEERESISVFPSMFLLVCFLIGVPGNGFVVWTILTKFFKRSLTLLLILNLAVTDLIVMSTVPFWMYSFLYGWVFGDVFCRVLKFLVYLTIYASIFLITLMSLHRFAVVIFPFASQKLWRPRAVHCALLMLWLAACLFGSPILIVSSKPKKEGICTDEMYYTDQQRITVNFVETLFGFVIPFTVMAVCYSCVLKRLRMLKSHKKMKTGKLIAAVVLSFFVCWLPYHVFNILISAALMLKTERPETAKTLLGVTKVATNIHGAVAFVSSCLNPILYAFAARSFRGGLRETNFAKLFAKIHEDSEEKSALEKSTGDSGLSTEKL